MVVGVHARKSFVGGDAGHKRGERWRKGGRLRLEGRRVARGRQRADRVAEFVVVGCRGLLARGDSGWQLKERWRRSQVGRGCGRVRWFRRGRGLNEDCKGVGLRSERPRGVSGRSGTE